MQKLWFYSHPTEKKCYSIAMKKTTQGKNPIIGAAITLAVFAVLAAAHFLLGSGSEQKRQAQAEAAAAAVTPAPTESPAPTATPYGVDAGNVIAALRLDGITVNTEGDVITLLLPPEDEDYEPADSETAELTLAYKHGFVSGFVLAFPVEPAAPKADGSAITNALILRNEAHSARQAEAMEELFLAVFSAYDTKDSVPATMRNEWCAAFLALQSSSNKKGGEDTCGKFRFATYTHGSGDKMKLCCSVQYQG